MGLVVNWRAVALVLVVAVITLTAAGAQKSSAAYPGRNGVIAFDADGRVAAQIFTMTASGGQLRQLTDELESSSEPQFSADGKRIVFERAAASGHGGMDIWVMHADGSHEQLLASDLVQSTSDAAYASPVWSPSGTKIAYSDRHGIWVVGIDGRHPRRVTRGNDGDPAWSPNGRWIAFDRSRDHAKKLDIWVVRAKGGQPRELKAGNSTSEPEWSPDGRWIAFDYIGHGVTGSIGVIKLDGKHPRTITRFNTFPTDRPAWSPDGKWLVYQIVPTGSDMQNLSKLYMVGIDGKHRHALTRAAHNAGDPAWQPLRG